MTRAREKSSYREGGGKEEGSVLRMKRVKSSPGAEEPASALKGEEQGGEAKETVIASLYSLFLSCVSLKLKLFGGGPPAACCSCA